MNTIAAFVASNSIGGLVLWAIVALVFLWFFAYPIIAITGFLLYGCVCFVGAVFEGIFYFVGSLFRIIWGLISEVFGWIGAILGFFPATIGTVVYYFQHREIFDRQNELETWLQEQFDTVGIKVRFTKWDRAGSYRSLVRVLSKDNLLFVAEVPDGKVGAYKRIVGVALNKFAWTKISSDCNFIPYRHLDRAWAKEYAVEKYVQPKFNDFCSCGCGKVLIRDFEWMILEDVPEGEVFFVPMGISGFDCRNLDRARDVSFRHDESAPCRELLVELTPEQKISLKAQIRKQEEVYQQRRRGY